MRDEEEKESRQPDMSRRKKVLASTIVIVVVAVVAVAYVVILSQSGASVTLLVTHYNLQCADPARVALYIDDTLEEEFIIEPGSDYTCLFKLERGNHTIGFDYTIAPSAEPDGVIDAEYSLEITTSYSIEYLWNVGSSGLLVAY